MGYLPQQTKKQPAPITTRFRFNAPTDKIEVGAAGFVAVSPNQFSYNATTGALSFLENTFAILENKSANFSLTNDLAFLV